MCLVLLSRPDKLVDLKNYAEQLHNLAQNDPEGDRIWRGLQELGKPANEQIKSREEQLKKTPNDIDTMYRLAQLYEGVDRLGQAENMYNLAYSTGRDKVFGARMLGQFLLRRHRIPDIRKLMDELVRIRGVDLVAAYASYGDFLLSNRDVGLAQDKFETAIKANEKDPRGWLAAAHFYAAMQHWDQAIAYMKQVLKLDPASQGRQPEKELVTYLLNRGAFDAASAEIGTMLDRHPNDIDLWTLKARQYQLQDALSTPPPKTGRPPTFRRPKKPTTWRSI